MKRKLKFKNKNRYTNAWFFLNKFFPRYKRMRGGISKTKDGYDWTSGKISDGHFELPIMEFFLNRKSRRQGEVFFYLLSDISDWETKTGRICYSNTVKDDFDKIEVYIHEKKIDTLSSK